MNLKKTINNINYCTTIIKTNTIDNKELTATGFFYRTLSEDRKFLITNKHVIKNNNYIPDYIQIRLHKHKKETVDFNVINIKLKENNQKLWLEYPNDEIYCDVVAIPLSKKTMSTDELEKFNNSNIIFFTRDNINSTCPCSFGKLSVIGYPKNFYDKIHNLPIYRQATIASQYTVDFMDEPFFLIDSKLHEGMSGSPVVSSGQETYGGLGFGGYNLFGIFSEEWEVGNEPLGLNTVWYAQLLIDITNDRN